MPADLDDALARLSCTLEPSTIDRMRSGAEEDMDAYHHSLGTMLRNEWGLWSGSRLASYFNALGLTHPDDMSGVILTSFWRRLNGQPLRVEDQVLAYQALWDAQYDPPPLICEAEEVAPIEEASEDEMPQVYVITYIAECPGIGWYRFTQADGDWIPIDDPE